MVLRTPVWMHTTLPAKNAYALVHAHPCNSADTSLPLRLLRTYLESCASIVQAAVAARSTAISTKLVAHRCSLQKSIQIHASSWRGCRCVAAQASSAQGKIWVLLPSYLASQACLRSTTHSLSSKNLHTHPLTHTQIHIFFFKFKSVH